jgi:lipoprotein-anchoring transpeptidase ErfK/SrfK
MKKFGFVLLSSAALSLAAFTAPASSGDRYGQRPPVVLSPDLSAPWVMQLGGQAAPRGGVVYRTKPRTVRTATRPSRSLFASPRRATPVAAAAPRVKPKPVQQFDQKFMPQTVAYNGGEKPGTIIIDTTDRFLYLVDGNGTARRYGVGVGKQGFEWAGTHKISRKAEWPDWRPPAEMIAREKEGPHPAGAHGRRAGQSARRPRALSRFDALPHPRHQPALDHRHGRLLGLHPHAQRGRHGPLSARQGRRQGDRDLICGKSMALTQDPARDVSAPGFFAP